MITRAALASPPLSVYNFLQAGHHVFLLGDVPLTAHAEVSGGCWPFATDSL